MAGQVVIVFFVGWVLFRLLRWLYRIEWRRIEAASWTHFAKFCGVLAVIFVCEAALPSLPMTGLAVKEPAVPHRHLDALEIGSDPMTYEEVATAADWLWPLGNVTQDEMKKRLRADIQIVEDRIQELDEPADPNRLRVSLLGRMAEKRRIRDEAFLQGLRDAEARLQIFFEGKPQMGIDADRFVFGQVERRLDEMVSANRRLQSELNRRLAENEIDTTNVSEIQDPALQALVEQSREASQRSLSIFSVLLDMKQTRDRLITRPAGFEAAQPFPAFNGPMPLYLVTAKTDAPPADETRLGPPADATFTSVLRGLRDAVTGAERASSTVRSETRCAIGFDQSGGLPELQQYCEISTPLALNYDLIATVCTEDTDGTAARLCKESWIFPHLNLVYEPGFFTVHPPLPDGVGSASWTTSGLSEWLISWKGETHRLDAPLRLAWSATDNTFEGLKLIHQPRRDAQNLQIWRDFDLHGPRRLPSGVLPPEAQDQQLFEAITFESPLQLRSQLKSLMASDGAGLKEQLFTGTVVRRTIERQSVYNVLVSDIREAEEKSSYPRFTDGFCGSMGRSSSQYRLSDMYTELEAFVENSSASVCEVYYADTAIMELIRRSDAEGSWLWMLR